MQWLIEFFRADARRVPGRAVVIRGGGESFCRGASVWAASDAASIIEAANLDRELGQLFAAIRDCPQPVIGLVDGEASEEGFALALLCDAVLASTTASFSAILSRPGPSACALALSWRLRQVPAVSATWSALLSTRRLTAQEAREVGLVHAVCEPNELEGCGATLARRLIAASSPERPAWPL